MRRYVPLVMIAAVALLPALAASKKVDPGSLGSADHWQGGETAALAVEVARAIERLDPEDNRNTARAGELLLKAGQTAEAEKLFDKAKRLDPEDDEMLGIIALAYRDAQMWDKVDEVYAKATKLDAEDLDHVAEWGVAYWRRGDKAKAGELFARVLSAEPDTVRIYYKIGRGISR